jgi:outer membrane cobalamin receptor
MKQRLTIFTIILLQSFIWTQTMTGSVKDRITNGNLNGVNITAEGTSQGTSTDVDGSFNLDVSGLSQDQMIKFQHIGYDELVLPLDSLLNGPKIITLQPRVLQFDAVETAGAKRKPAIEKDLPQTVAILQAEEFELRAFVDAGDLLATDQSIQVEESLSGRKTISIRGGNADDVLVLYNGFRLNRPYDNVFDLSLVDMQNVEQIEIVKGGHSVLYGPDAFSGVVNIVPKNTKDKNVRVSQQFGSYASGFWNANAQAQLGNTFLSLSQKQGSYKRVFEDLDVDDTGLLTKLTHRSMDMSNQLKGNKVNGNLEFNVTQDDQLFHNKRDFNKIKSQNQLFGIQYDGVLGLLGEIEIAVANHKLEETQGLNSYTGFVSRKLDHNANKFEVRKYINMNRLEWMFGTQMEKSLLKFWDDRNLTNVHQVGLKGANLNRDQFGFATVLKLHSKGDDAGKWLTDLDVSFRQDQVKDYKDNLVYRGNHEPGVDGRTFLDFGENNWNNKIVKISTIASKRSLNKTMAYWVTTGNNVKFPSLQQQISLTDLPPGGRTANLLPEKMKSLEIGINVVSQPADIPTIDQLELQGSFFRNDFINKMRITYLLGMPIGYYENIGHADMMGFEAKMKAKTYGGALVGEIGFSKYKVSDQSAFPFKSTFKLTVNMTAKWKYITFGTRWFQEGEQVGMINVPSKGFNEIELPAFSNYDIYWTVDVNVGPIKGDISYSGRNLKKNDTSLNGLMLRDTRKYFTFSTEL